MTTPDAVLSPQDRADRQGRRRPFSTWMKKLTNFKHGSNTNDQNGSSNIKKNTYQMKSHSKKDHAVKNNPYPESGIIRDTTPTNRQQQSTSTTPTRDTASLSSFNNRGDSILSSEDGLPPPTIGNKSTAATMSTDVAHSDAAPSHTTSSGGATNATVGGNTGRGADSTFSSPAPSVRSLTTTLTTIHSAAAAPAPTSNTNGNGNNTSIQFSHQFPTSPPHAIPPHLAPQGSGGHPATYSTATANNLLTDNASILTLASSSNRRRRRSMDTDASVRALAPSSLFGGSRESLPQSVLSATIDSPSTTAAHQSRPNVGLSERASIYSATGVTPALPSERNSFYAGKQSATADGGSVQNGLLGHGRNDSISGSIGGPASPSSPLASARDGPVATGNGKLSRTNSAWEEIEVNKKSEIETEVKDEDEAEESKA